MCWRQRVPLCQALVALDARVPQRGILGAAESEHRLIHLLGVEHLEADEQMKVFHRRAGDGREQVRLQFGNPQILEILASLGSAHPHR